MRFAEIFNKSFDEYKKNFKNLFKLTFVFIGIPSLLGIIVLYLMSLSDPVFYTAFVYNNFETLTSIFYVVVFLLSLLSIVLYLMFETGLINESLNKKNRIGFEASIKSGKKNFWKFVWFSLISIFLLALLFLAFIIPGIIFMIYWFLAVYIYFDSKKTVIGSLRASFYLVKGNWWRIFGYTILIFLLLGIIGLILNLFTIPLSFYIEGLADPSLELVFANFFIEDLVNFFNVLISVPFAVLFYKNIYLELRKEKKDGKGKKNSNSKK